jgi:hypothetical protein
LIKNQGQQEEEEEEEKPAFQGLQEELEKPDE